MISLIAAVAKNRVIGKSNALPWDLPKDLEHFRKITAGGTVIMGRKTYDSIITKLGKPLPNRKNIVITSNPNYAVADGVEIYPSLELALKGREADQVFLIGGSGIFKQGLDLADALYLTELKNDYDGDVFFPEFDKTQWNREVEEPNADFDFVKYTRKAKF
jgi:dihydrofolate reductase